MIDETHEDSHHPTNTQYDVVGLPRQSTRQRNKSSASSYLSSTSHYLLNRSHWVTSKDDLDGVTSSSSFSHYTTPQHHPILLSVDSTDASHSHNPLLSLKDRPVHNIHNHHHPQYHYPSSTSKSRNFHRRYTFVVRLLGVLLVFGLLTTVVLLILLEKTKFEDIYDTTTTTTTFSITDGITTTRTNHPVVDTIKDLSGHDSSIRISSLNTISEDVERTTGLIPKEEESDVQTKNSFPPFVIGSTLPSAITIQRENPEGAESQHHIAVPSNSQNTLQSMPNNTRTPQRQRRRRRQERLLLSPLPSSLKYLGLLLDAGRHHFPIDWIYELFHHMHAMDYNYLHFRLTDDQVWALNITAYPNLNSNSNNNNSYEKKNRDPDYDHDDNGGASYMGFNARGESVYTPDQLRMVVRDARLRYNITIIPEINLPGHAGSWGVTLPHLVVQCPQFACRKGYGIPLNVSHPDMTVIVQHVLTQVVDIFDRPPYLHLGGDEIHMSEPCLKEAHVHNMTHWYIQSVETFERDIVLPIITDLGYSEHQIIRWETKTTTTATTTTYGASTQTGLVSTSTTRTPWPTLYRRTGEITHYWESLPSDYQATVWSEQPYLASTGLYMDVFRRSGGVNTDTTLDLGYGYGDYTNARRYVTGGDGPPPPLGIIVGTFELSVDFWNQRNVLGRLLAVRMGVSTVGDNDDGNNGIMSEGILSIDDFKKVYIPTCLAIFGSTDGNSSDIVKLTNQRLMMPLNTADMCSKVGLPLVEDKLYQASWKNVWGEWRKGLCGGLTVTTYQRRVEPTSTSVKQRLQANVYYWDNLFGGRVASSPADEPILMSPITAHEVLLPRNTLNSTTRQDLHVGFSMDLVHDPISPQSFKDLLQSIQLLGFNLIQLRLSDDFGQVVEWQSIPDLAYSHILTDHDSDSSRGSTVGTRSTTTPYYYDRYHLEKMVDWARQVGINILPEINLATNGGGWYKGGMLMNCPRTLCERGEGIAFDVVNNLEGVLPVALGVIREMKEIFFTTPFLHLGSDERRASEECFQEAGYHPSEAKAALNRFETKLSSALSLMGIDLSRIIRWENQERTLYPNRTGIVTQLIDEIGVDVVDGNDSSTNFFGTVTVTDQMEELDVFESTRRWIELKPKGLVLRTSSGHTPPLQLLVAFALGLSTSEIGTKETFQLAHAKLCCKIRCRRTDNQSVANAELATKHLWKDAILAKACLERTANVTVKKFKSYGR